jgi:hypothetical protein
VDLGREELEDGVIDAERLASTAKSPLPPLY